MPLLKRQIEAAERAVAQVERSSRQLPATDRTANRFFHSTYNWVKKMEMEEPVWQVDNRARDQWLRTFVKQEPHLGSVLSMAVTLDVNRGYTITGGRNQVIRYAERLKGVQDGEGWRALKAPSAREFYNSDVGSVTEVETDGEGGPLLSLYHVDSAEVVLTGDPTYPIKYYGGQSEAKPWRKSWFYRFASLPSPQRSMNRLGYCAVSRCIKLAQIMISIVEHNLEKLGTLAPKGLLLLESESLTPEQWEQAVATREQVVVGQTGNRYFDEIMVLVDRAIKGDILAFSELPDGFDTFQFTDYMMKAYALAFNRDVRAFWAINSGNFGAGREAQIQYERAYYTGIGEYPIQDQDHLQELLPATLLFEYDVDDTRGKMLKAELAEMWTRAGKNLIDIGLDVDRTLSVLADAGIVDKEWTQEDESYSSSGSLTRIRERLKEKPQVQRAIARYHEKEPIVQFSWPDHRIRTIWKPGENVVRQYWQVDDLPWLQLHPQKFRARKETETKYQDIDIQKFIQLVGSVLEQGLSREQFTTSAERILGSRDRAELAAHSLFEQRMEDAADQRVKEWIAATVKQKKAPPTLDRVPEPDKEEDPSSELMNELE